MVHAARRGPRRPRSRRGPPMMLCYSISNYCTYTIVVCMYVYMYTYIYIYIYIYVTCVILCHSLAYYSIVYYMIIVYCIAAARRLNSEW